MRIKSALALILTGGFYFFTWSDFVLAEVKAKYDAFTNKTTFTLTGEWVENKPIFHVFYESDGQKPDPRLSAQVGFYIRESCGDPNFVADGKRVQPEPASEALKPHMTVVDLKSNGVTYPAVFGYTDYNLPQIRQIAEAKSVKYQLCDRIFTLSPKDQTELRKFLSYFKDK